MALLTRQVEYKYDAFGNRLAKEIDLDGEGELGVEVQRYAIDGWNPAKASPVGNENFDVIADLDGSSSLTTRYVRGDKVDEVNARIENVESALTAYWNLVDHQGSARDIIINNGDIKDSIKYDSFGKIAIESDDTFRGRYTWTSRELDKETELQFNRARYYDATIGRWISQDPMGFDAGDSNLYRYTKNVAAVSTDPSGLLDVSVNPLGTAVSLRLPNLGKGIGTISVYKHGGIDPQPENKDNDMMHIKFLSDGVNTRKVHFLQFLSTSMRGTLGTGIQKITNRQNPDYYKFNGRPLPSVGIRPPRFLKNNSVVR